MLRLMTLDPAPSIYVGRPCYFGLANDPPCTPRDWPLDRFSPRVVDSMARLIEQLREGRQDAIELYGHSGGGALAVLLAARLGGVQRIVTIGGNLDVDAWTAYHGYTPLEGSLNPVNAGPLPATLLQEHYVGDRDRVVPPEMVEAAALRLDVPGAIVLRRDARARLGARVAVDPRGRWRSGEAIPRSSESPTSLGCLEAGRRRRLSGPSVQLPRFYTDSIGFTETQRNVAVLPSLPNC